jgi:NAD(P)-dependent dehydrogenase (short-subunit alcohol dehydrogenase family)
VIITIVPEADPKLEIDAGAYASSMEGLRMLTYSAAQELSQFGIQVYAVENAGAEKVVEKVLSLLDQEAK